MTSRRATAALGALAAVLLLWPREPAHSATLDVPALVAGCAGHHNGAWLTADNDVLCFDGAITHKTSLDPFRRLNSGGTLVVRSPGGLTLAAMRIADILREKSATVVIHDYCLSACANAIFVATNATHVADNAIVAWHGSSAMEILQACFSPERRHGDKRAGHAIARFAELCRDRELVLGFYKRRGITDDFVRRPQTLHTRKMVHAMMRESLEKRSVFWTWHPQNFGNYFKSRITFGAFPSQDEAAARAQRLGLLRLVYDPPSDHEAAIDRRPRATVGPKLRER